MFNQVDNHTPTKAHLSSVEHFLDIDDEALI